MKLNADLSRPAAALLSELPWQPSPDGSVQRRMLDRDGGEVARATSVVRYPQNSRFPAHRHDRGEEFLVLEGVFSDEHGDYPAGTYVRNPPGSIHTPYSTAGCVLFVKLRQFASDDLERVVIDTRAATWSDLDTAGSRLPLHRHDDEAVALVRLEAGATLPDKSWPGGVEILVLEGIIEDTEGQHPADSWLRLPPGTRRRFSSKSGALFYLKRGHLQVVTDQ